VVERNTVECRVVGLTFAPTEWIGKALRGRALIGGAIHGLRVADRKESIVSTDDLSMWVRWEARTVSEVNTGPRVRFELVQVLLWLWL
jgi:hypothetical protein